MLLESVHRRNRSSSAGGFLLVCVLVTTGRSFAQNWTSGSNGSDGALNLTTPGTIVFDPKTSNPPLDPDGDNIYHFTTINVGPGVTVKLTSNVLTGPVFWLATGNVQIEGVIDLNGEAGHGGTSVGSVRRPNAAGAGGYSGGLGGSRGPGSTLPPPSPGNGPGGGAASAGTGSGAPGTFTGNQYLVPLFGGSGGGGGGHPDPNAVGSGGGSGGGAMLIASSTLIRIVPQLGGQIRATGGVGGGGGGNGGEGSGGAVRLAAPRLEGGCNGNLIQLGNGRVRLEFNSRGDFCVGGNLTEGPLGALLLPTVPPPSIRVTSINGIPVNANPFTFPDVTINSVSPVTVTVEARQIPIGTVPKLYVFGENFAQQIIDITPLQGTLQLSTASAQVQFVSGGSRGYVKAVWQ